ncbi:hypothetical protein [Arsenicicoccus sp. oral taxon 190]|uniref:hypothetical protein n=1 Tax=Arsenicicoccus sp. oral taxon 190 TaxID=1658671 RepID=UPI00067A09C9|nr:hypothetical protein [Arsenicicoccus sp. oral taxon 190]AKT51518.1 hypothetical protein ADJ73_09715 [Arsenicicoccus sp. oral taxon 190]
MAAPTGHPVRHSVRRPVLGPGAVVAWLVAPTLVALCLLLALAAVVTLMMDMAPFALASLTALVGSVVGFWTFLDRRS